MEQAFLRNGNVHSADDWQSVLEPSISRYRYSDIPRFFRGDAGFADPEIYRFLESEDYFYLYDMAEKVKRIWPILNKIYPEAKTALRFKNPLELLIATILSAQCADVRVNMVTKDLFRKYKSPADWAKADMKQIESDIKTSGFYHNKAISINRACAGIIQQFDGKVPYAPIQSLTGNNCNIAQPFGKGADLRIRDLTTGKVIKRKMFENVA